MYLVKGYPSSLGILYWDQGKLAEAEQMYVRALAGYEALQSENIPALETVCNLGVLTPERLRHQKNADTRGPDISIPLICLMSAFFW